MEYQNTGADGTSRLVYIPVVQTYQTQPQITQKNSVAYPKGEVNPQAPYNDRRKKSRSCFTKFFNIEDGVISISLRDMTLFGCISLTVALLTMLYQTCSDPNSEVDCVYPVLPMISDVVCLPFYDRIFCLLTCFFTMACFQVDCRAFFKRLNGIATDRQNDTLLVLGFVASFALPLIGFFDEHNYLPLHCTLAVLFFGSVGIYSFIIGSVMQANINSFPESQWKEIALMNKLKWIMLVTLFTLLASWGFKGSEYWLTPFAEWVTTILFINYFALLSFTNNYFDSVHPFEATGLSPRVVVAVEQNASVQLDCESANSTQSSIYTTKMV